MIRDTTEGQSDHGPFNPFYYPAVWSSQNP